MSPICVRESLNSSRDGELKAVQYRPKQAPGSLDAKHLSERFNLKVLCQKPQSKAAPSSATNDIVRDLEVEKSGRYRPALVENTSVPALQEVFHLNLQAPRKPF